MQCHEATFDNTLPRDVLPELLDRTPEVDMKCEPASGSSDATETDAVSDDGVAMITGQVQVPGENPVAVAAPAENAENSKALEPKASVFFPPVTMQTALPMHSFLSRSTGSRSSGLIRDRYLHPTA